MPLPNLSVSNIQDGWQHCLVCNKKGIKDSYYGKYKTFCSIECAKWVAQQQEPQQVANSISKYSMKNKIIPGVPKTTPQSSCNNAKHSSQCCDGESKQCLTKMRTFLPLSSMATNGSFAVNRSLSPLFHDNSFAPVSAFCHAPLKEVYLSFSEKNTLVDIAHPRSKLKFWRCKILNSYGYFLKLEYLSPIKHEEQIIFVNPHSRNLYPVTEYDEKGQMILRKYSPPNFIASCPLKFIFSPSSFASHRENLELATLDKDLYGSFKDELVKLNMYDSDCHYEVIDHMDTSRFVCCKIIDLFGEWLLVEYQLGNDCTRDPKTMSQWVHPKSGFLRVMGWSQMIGYPIYAPKSYMAMAIFLLTKSDHVSENLTNPKAFLFEPNVENKFPVGSYLEFLDPYEHKMKVAVVAKILRFGFMIIKSPFKDDKCPTHTILQHVTSPLIFPVGYCFRNSIPLFVSSKVRYSPDFVYIKNEVARKGAPNECFPVIPNNNKFKQGMILETFNVFTSNAISYAMVDRVVGRLISLRFILQDPKIEYWVEYQSYHIRPFGFAQMFDNAPCEIFIDNIRFADFDYRVHCFEENYVDMKKKERGLFSFHNNKPNSLIKHKPKIVKIQGSYLGLTRNSSLGTVLPVSSSNNINTKINIKLVTTEKNNGEFSDSKTDLPPSTSSNNLNNKPITDEENDIEFLGSKIDSPEPSTSNNNLNNKPIVDEKCDVELSDSKIDPQESAASPPPNDLNNELVTNKENVELSDSKMDSSESSTSPNDLNNELVTNEENDVELLDSKIDSPEPSTSNNNLNNELIVYEECGIEVSDSKIDPQESAASNNKPITDEENDVEFLDSKMDSQESSASNNNDLIIDEENDVEILDSKIDPQESSASNNKPTTDEENDVEFSDSKMDSLESTASNDNKLITDEENDVEFSDSKIDPQESSASNNNRPITDEENDVEFSDSKMDSLESPASNDDKLITDEENDVEFSDSKIDLSESSTLNNKLINDEENDVEFSDSKIDTQESSASISSSLNSLNDEQMNDDLEYLGFRIILPYESDDHFHQLNKYQEFEEKLLGIGKINKPSTDGIEGSPLTWSVKDLVKFIKMNIPDDEFNFKPFHLFGINGSKFLEMSESAVNRILSPNSMSMATRLNILKYCLINFYKLDVKKIYPIKLEEDDEENEEEVIVKEENKKGGKKPKKRKKKNW